MIRDLVSAAPEREAEAPVPAPAPTPDQRALEARLDALAIDIEPIQGWLHPDTGKLLYHLARAVPAAVIVELGSWKGRSTAWLANGVRDRGEGRVYAVDTWKGTGNEAVHREMLAGYAEGQLYREFIENLRSRSLLDLVEPIRADTVSAAHDWDPARKIGLLFIDADHDYAAVRRDFEYWSPHVATGGAIVFDDVTTWWGPSRLVSELPKWYNLDLVRPNIWVVVKQGA